MSEKTKTEQPAERIRLSVASIVAGKYIGIGEPTPFMTESDVPPNLKPYIGCIRNEMLPHPSDRDIYMTPQARRQARRLEAIAQEKEQAEEFASQPLREDVAAALADSHAKYIGKALAEAQSNQDAIDRLHESLAAAAEPTEFFVRRGSVYSRVEKVKLQPAEQYFARRANGEMEYVGVIDSHGSLPPSEITT